MTRRYPDMRITRNDWTDGDKIAVGIGFIVAIILVVGAISLFASMVPAKAHESWINKGGYKNSANEWCCGADDCKAYEKARSTPQGWMLDGELIPYDEALSVAPPDGQVTVCRRSDGTRRCVFGVKPGL